MKKHIYLLGILSIAFLFTSCGVHYPMTSNINNNVTSVELGEKNFKVIDRVKGESSATYVLGFGAFGHMFGWGGLKKGMVQEAKADMMKDVELVGKARAITNETVEMQVSNYVVFAKFHVIVSANVIEFTE